MQLTVIAGPDTGRSFPLADGQTLLVGRGQASHTQLADPHMSRVHCRVEVDGPAVTVSDAGSASGTLVNGQPVERQELRPGDVISVGETQLRFLLEAGHDASTLVGAPQPLPEGAALGLDQPPLDVRPLRMRASASPLEELLGQTLHQFEIQEVLAPAATGMVFKGHDTKKDRPVAVKVLAPEYAGSEEQKQRFIRAMETMLPIRHENIVALHGAGKKGPYCWVAMEYVEGESLTQVIGRIGAANMLDWREAYRVAIHVGRALEEAAKHSIIHRNVTPNNILQRREDKQLKLGDLMLAKALEGVHARQVTRPGELVGDVAYMAPERTRDAANIDARSDIYGLGATVYALLAGRPPFEARALPELITKIRNEDPAPPKQFQLSIPDLFEGVVLRMLSKRVENRYQTPTELVKDLLRVGKYQGVDF